MTKKGFKPPRLEIPSPPAPGDNDFTLDLSTTTWNQLVGDGGVSGFNYASVDAVGATEGGREENTVEVDDKGKGEDFERFVGSLSPFVKSPSSSSYSAFPSGPPRDFNATSTSNPNFGLPPKNSSSSLPPQPPDRPTVNTSIGIGGGSGSGQRKRAHPPSTKSSNHSSLSHINTMQSSGLTPSLATAPTPANFFSGSSGHGGMRDSGEFARLAKGIGDGIGNDMTELMPSTKEETSGGGSGGGSINSLRMSVDSSDGRPLSAKGRALFFRHIGGEDNSQQLVSSSFGVASSSTRAKAGSSNPNYRFNFNEENFVYDSVGDEAYEPTGRGSRTRGSRTRKYNSGGGGGSGGGGRGSGVGRVSGGGGEVSKGRNTNSQRIIAKAQIQQKIKDDAAQGLPNTSGVEEITRNCRCKKSRCLKLYCECFAASVYCTPGVCICADCNNLYAFERVRIAAIENALSRNAEAFDNKVTKAAKRAAMTGSNGCNCRKSACLKKYCECFFTGMLCLKTCNCINCENYKGSSLLAKKRAEMKKAENAAAADIDVPQRTKKTAPSKGNTTGLRSGGASPRLKPSQSAEPIFTPAATNPPLQKGISVDTEFSSRIGGMSMNDSTAAALSLNEEDWNYAATLSAEALDHSKGSESAVSSPNSTRHINKRNRMFSPKRGGSEEESQHNYLADVSWMK